MDEKIQILLHKGDAAKDHLNRGVCAGADMGVGGPCEAEEGVESQCCKLLIGLAQDDAGEGGAVRQTVRRCEDQPIGPGDEIGQGPGTAVAERIKADWKRIGRDKKPHVGDPIGDLHRGTTRRPQFYSGFRASAAWRVQGR